MKKFEIRHNDGTTQIVKATNEDMARQFAMENKWGGAKQNSHAWRLSSWRGDGLSVKELFDA